MENQTILLDSGKENALALGHPFLEERSGFDFGPHGKGESRSLAGAVIRMFPKTIQYLARFLRAQRGRDGFTFRPEKVAKFRFV